MKLYDVIKKEDLERGTPLKDTPTEQPSHLTTPHQKISWKKMMVIGGCITVLALLYVIGMKVVYARVHVVQRRIPFSLEDTQLELIHEKEATNTRLSFQTMVVSAEVSREVYGSELTASTSRATGKVIFFNEYSKSTQTVKVKTTLTGKNGKKYQTQEKVTVPGYTLKGKLKIAGTSIPVNITAVDVGPASNTTGTSFTVAGWTGSTTSKQFYAQSAGEVSGGEDGMAHVLSSADKPQVIATLQSQLTEKLKRETRAQIPDDLISFPDLQFVTVDVDSLQIKGSTIKFPASIKGTMVSYLMSRDLLENAIANKTLHGQSFTDVSIPDLGGISVTPITAIPVDPNSIPESIKVNVSGDGTVIAKVSPEKIQEILVGIRKAAFGSTLSSIPEIDTARYTLYPFWAPLFPAKDTNIKIIVE